MIYMVDIDQTICKTPYTDGQHRYGLATPFKHRIEKINKLYDQGNTIISVSYTHLTLPTNREV